jgi:Rrf2 family protein
MKLLSDASEYALRAVVWLAAEPSSPQTTQQIAVGAKAAPGYLARVLQDLGKAGILKARRGAGGGFALARDPKDLTALEVINAVDPIERIQRCPLELVSHGDRLCPLHHRIDEAIAQLQDAFASTTVGDLLAEPGAPTPLCEQEHRASDG